MTKKEFVYRCRLCNDIIRIEFRDQRRDIGLALTNTLQLSESGTVGDPPIYGVHQISFYTGEHHIGVTDLIGVREYQK